VKIAAERIIITLRREGGGAKQLKVSAWEATESVQARQIGEKNDEFIVDVESKG
jgi:hypothetical protein